jgi:hypothetical protein
MDPLPPRLGFLFLLFSGWVNQHQQAVIDYLLEERSILGTTRWPATGRLLFEVLKPSHLGVD